jgi:hypothetical protein
MADNPTAMRSHSRRPLCNLLRWHTKLLKQGYAAPMLKSSLHKLYGHIQHWTQNKGKQNKNTTQKTKKMNNTDPTKQLGVNSGARGAHVLSMIFVFVAYRGVPHSVISYVRTFSVPCCDVRIKRCSVRLCPQYFYMRVHGIFRQELFTLLEHLGSFPVFWGGPCY